MEIDRENGINITEQIIVSCFVSNQRVHTKAPIFVCKNDLYSIITKPVDRLDHVLEIDNIVTKQQYALVLDDVLKYVVNIANMLTTQVDLVNPTNPERDIRVCKNNTSAKKEHRKDNNKMTIRVFGETRKIAEAYNNEKQKHGNQLDATHVAGFWRHYVSERYTKMRGKVEWLKPFYRGKDRELMSKVVKVISKR